MKKILWIGLLVALVGGGWWWSRHRSSTEALAAEKKPEYAKVESAPFRVTVDATGRVIPEQEIEIKCKASGTIQKLPVEVSDRVKKDGLLVQLDPVDEKRSVAQAEVGLAQAQARLGQAQLNLVMAKQDLKTQTTQANANLVAMQARKTDAVSKADRTRQLFAKKMASPEEKETAELAETQATTDLIGAQARVDDLATLQTQVGLREQDVAIAREQLHAGQLALDIAQQRLVDTTVNAPIDGVVSELNVQVGQIIASGINNVGGGTTVMKLADLSRIYVMVSVDESDIGRVALNQTVEVTVDAHPDVLFPGTVVQIAAKGDVSANVVTFAVKVEVTGEQRQLLKPQMTANVEIETVKRETALLAPLTAMIRQKRDWLVDVKTPAGGTERKQVTVGASNGEFIEVLSGLKAGDEVLVRPLGNQDRWSKEKVEAGKPARPEGHPQ